MNPRHHIGIALLAAGITMPTAAGAYGLSVEVWTDRGRDAVYRPGEALEINARTSSDAHLLVYEIDSEGYVHVLFPEPGRTGFVEGRETHSLPGPDSDVELVVQEPVGQGYIVAIASVDPFGDLPWYLRAYDRHAEQVGYYDRDENDDEEGVTAEGRVVGDPFVAMERIRRRVVADSDDEGAFATAYTSYYVHHEVRYPRYVCYDCHRPGYWAWWDGFDPYYAQCSVFDVRVNWHWAWGPRYWFGQTPYFVYVYRTSCPPAYRPAFRRGDCYSSWDGWSRWRSLWGQKTRRFKTPPPVGYEPPDSRLTDRRGRGDRRMPPGFVPAPGVDDPPMAVVRGGSRGSSPVPGRSSGLSRRVMRGRGAAVEPLDGTLDRPTRELGETPGRSSLGRRVTREPVRIEPRWEPRSGRRGFDPPQSEPIRRRDVGNDMRRDRRVDVERPRDTGNEGRGGRREVEHPRDTGYGGRPDRGAEARRPRDEKPREARVERGEGQRDRGQKSDRPQGGSSERDERRRSR